MGDFNKYPSRVGGLNASEVIALYASLRSFAGIAKPNLTPQTVTLPAATGGNYSIQHVALATSGGTIRGNAFTVNTDGTITANRNMFAVSVACMMVATWGNADNIVLGIGIGNPDQIPSRPGVQVGENYVSRFRDGSVGQGGARECVLATPYEPVGKSTTKLDVYGVKAGDKLFPVAWTQESDSASVSVIDLIFTAQEISI